MWVLKKRGEPNVVMHAIHILEWVSRRIGSYADTPHDQKLVLAVLMQQLQDMNAEPMGICEVSFKAGYAYRELLEKHDVVLPTPRVDVHADGVQS